ncbi:Fur family transcriptional regulator, ferric uptake regulator [Promicromonospora umidemergens]|nr:Fur family transcriptional regulator, ferric uptake regulator [Promicromonospora umidemergens]
MTGPARRPSPRSLVRRELATSDRFRTANDIYLTLAEQRHRASLSTVYRTLTALADSELAETVYLPAAGTAYRLRPREAAGPYLVCVRCGTAAPVPTAHLAPWFRSTAARQGFTEVEARIEIWGRCKACRQGLPTGLNDNDSQF